MNLSGLGAAYPGYLDAMKAEGAGRLAQTNADTGEIDAMGRQALGRALFQAAMPGASPMPGTPAGGPQPPPPGQASMPSQSPMSAPDPSAGGGMPGQAGMPQPPQQQGMPQPPQQQGMPQLDLQTVIGRIQQANPGIKPEVLMSALERAAPILSQQAKQDMAAMKLQLQQEMVGLRERSVDRQERQGDARLNQGQQWIDRLPGGARPPSGGSAGAPGGPRAPRTAAPAATSPGADMSTPPPTSLKEGVVTTFANGTRWTLEGGQPKQVP